MDEADTIFGTPKQAEKNEEMRGLLNAGHQRNRYVTRVVGNDHTPHKFATFAMAALAGIGDLPDTIMDRSVVIRMRRRAEGENVKPFRSRRDIPGPARPARPDRRMGPAAAGGGGGAWSRTCRSRTAPPTPGSPW